MPCRASPFLYGDAVKCFHLSDGSGKNILDRLEFDCALTKVAKLCYKTANNAACSRLLRDIRSTISFTENWDGVRSQILLPSVLSKLTAYSDALYQTFETCANSRQIAELDRSERLALSMEGCVDYFTGYFICPEFITPDRVLEITSDVMESFPTLNSHTAVSYASIGFPQFIEILCQVAIVSHGNRVQSETGNLRKAIETAKLDFCLQSLFTSMDLTPNLDEHEFDKTEARVPDLFVGNRLLALTQELRELIEIMRAPVLPHEYEPLSSTPSMNTVNRDASAKYTVIIVKDVLNFPSCSKRASHLLEKAMTYQDNDDFKMALCTLEEAQGEILRDSSARRSIEDDIFFFVAKGNVFDTQLCDDEALHFYLKATKVLQHLPDEHPVRAIVYSCLGKVCFYIGDLKLALQCYILALRVRLKECSSSVNTATALNNVGCCLYEMGHREDAHARFKTSLHILRETLGIGHPRSTVVFRNVEVSKFRGVGVSRGSLKMLSDLRLDTTKMIPALSVDTSTKKKTKRKAGKKKKKQT